MILGTGIFTSFSCFKKVTRLSIIAFDFKDGKSRDDFVLRAFEKGLLINRGGIKTVRMRPNLAITDTEVEELISILKEITHESVG